MVQECYLQIPLMPLETMWRREEKDKSYLVKLAFLQDCSWFDPFLLVDWYNIRLFPLERGLLLKTCSINYKCLIGEISFKHSLRKIGSITSGPRAFEASKLFENCPT